MFTSAEASKKIYDYTLNPALESERKKRRKKRILSKAAGFFRLAQAAENLGRLRPYTGCVEVFRGTVHLPDGLPTIAHSFGHSDDAQHAVFMNDLLQRMGEAIIRKYDLEEYFRFVKEHETAFDIASGRFAVDGTGRYAPEEIDISEGYFDPHPLFSYLPTVPLFRTTESPLIPGTLIRAGATPPESGEYGVHHLPDIRVRESYELVPVRIQTFREAHLAIASRDIGGLGLMFQIRDMLVPFSLDNDSPVELDGCYHHDPGWWLSSEWETDERTGIFLDNPEDSFPSSFMPLAPYCLGYEHFHHFTVNSRSCLAFFGIAGFQAGPPFPEPIEYVPHPGTMGNVLFQIPDASGNFYWPAREIGALVERNMYYAPREQNIKALLEDAVEDKISQLEHYKRDVSGRLLEVREKLFQEWENDDER